ncbi:hypothetical protein [Lunatibacter salilacus]|nr:hypothetical protein [Lunatibacter salilacus]
MKSSLPTGQAGMTRTSHNGMNIMVRFPVCRQAGTCLTAIRSDR